MAKSMKRICKCCGKEYDYCPHCGKRTDEIWKNLTDTEECREVLNIVAAYNTGRVNKDRVKEVLDAYGVTDYNKYKPSIAKVLNDLFKEEPVKTQAVVVEELKIENEVSVPNVEEAKEVIQSEYSSKKKNYKRRKHYYTDVDSN